MRGNDLYNDNEKVFRADHGKESGDDFGLPKSGSSSTGGGGARPGSTYKAPPPPPPAKSSSGLGIILGIIFLALIIFVVYWFLIRKPKPVVEPVIQDTTTVQTMDTVTRIEPEPVVVDTVPAHPAGEIATINSRTGRYYVVISSSIDSDLANDYAKKLTLQGVQCTILSPPIERKGYFKLSVADFESLEEANTKMEELKGTYGTEIWVLKY